MSKEDFMDIAIDAVEKHFPIGKTKMRGEVMILVADILVGLMKKGVIEADTEVNDMDTELLDTTTSLSNPSIPAPQTSTEIDDIPYLVWNLVDHYQNDHPDADQTQECRYAIETIEEITALLTSHQVQLLKRLESLLPKRVPDKFFAKNRDDSPWSMGWNDAITEVRRAIAQLRKGEEKR